MSFTSLLEGELCSTFVEEKHKEEGVKRGGGTEGEGESESENKVR